MNRFSSSIDDTDWQRRLQRGKARHLPLQAHEVAEYSRPLSWWLWEFAKVAITGIALGVVVSAMMRGAGV